ncbi:hypothetical protein [Shivajiella indica]|uniref:Uncharacterized protein n=1 Tax=Shivajiella indica TaxID=872115 RepID=A0ABW5B4B1_9BACT
MKIIKTILLHSVFFVSSFQLQAQIDKETLSLNISKAEEANQLKLKEYIWKRRSDVFIESQLKLTTITEFSYSANGELETKIVDAETTVEKKPGFRGKAQASAAEDKMEYIEKALKIALDYTFMTKGELLDFFSKATVTEKNGLIEAVADDVHVKGDRLMVGVDPDTHMFTYKEFTSLLGQDKIEGKLNYEKFSDGTNHLSTTMLNLPAQKMNIDAKNQDYTIRIK